MHTINDVVNFLEQFAPPSLAESWDNVGLLVGDGGRTVSKLMTCLTVTPASAAEAIAGGANLIVTHHPLPFRALSRVTTETTAGRLLLDLIEHRVSIYSPHTAFDSAREGINQRLAEGLGLNDIRVLLPAVDGDLGAGRYGTLSQPLSLQALAERVKAFLHVPHLHCIGKLDQTLERVAVACGSGGEFVSAAQQAGCSALVTGEARFHTCLEAEATGIALVLAGHFASERFAVEQLASVLAKNFTALEAWPSREESDPLQWL